MTANHADKKVLFNGHSIDVPAGSFITSETKLAERWKWSRKKVDGFLVGLEIGGSLVLKKSSKSTMVYIENWGKYQEAGTEEEPQKNIKRTSEEHQKNTNKNDKNVKNNTPPISPSEKDPLDKLAPEVQEAFREYIADRKERRDPMTSRAITLNVNKLLSLSSDPETQIAIIMQTIERRWNGLFEIKGDKPRAASRTRATNHSTRKYTTEELSRIGVDLLEEEKS